MPRILLLRHVESEANVAGVGLGRADSPPTTLGLQQAEALAEALRGWQVSRVLTSPLQRAAQLAEAVAGRHGLDAEPREDLLEMDVGELEGVEWAEVRRRYTSFLKRWNGDGSADVRTPGGESLADVMERSWRVVEELAGELDEEGCAAIVSHNFVLRTVICRAIGLDLGRWRHVEVGLASRSMLRFEEAGVRLEELNDRAHLDGLVS